MSGFWKFLAVAVGAIACVVVLNYAAGGVYSPDYPETPAYVIEGADTFSPDQLILAQRNWPTSSLRSRDRAALRGYMQHFPEIKLAAADSTETKTSDEPKMEMSLPDLLAKADAGKGKKVAKKCVSCHTFDDGGKNGVGPNLWGIVGGKQAGVGGFSYSNAMKGLGGTWSYEQLDAFLISPKRFLKGTKMSFGGVKRAGQRADLLAYLQSKSANPVAFPTAAASQ